MRQFDHFIKNIIEENFDIDYINNTVEFVDKAAQSIFAGLWADWMQEEVPKSSKYFQNLSGEEVTDFAPPFEKFLKGKELQQFEDYIYEFITQFEEANDNQDINELYAKALEFDGQDPENIDERSSKEMFGYYIIMRMMGHGVSWEDSHNDPGFAYPHIELSYMHFPESFHTVENKEDYDDEEVAERQEENEDDEDRESWEKGGDWWKP